MLRLTAVLVIVSCAGVFAGDEKCLSRSGRCQADYNSCLGGYRSSLCSGASNRRCCLPASGDTRCSRNGGFCQDQSLSCGGGYRSGLCAGGSNRRCCLPQSGGGGTIGGQTGGSCLTSTEMTALKETVERFENLRHTAYDAQPKNKKFVDLTVCIGFNLKRKEAKDVFNQILPGVSFQEVYDGRKSLSTEQCTALFENDLTKTYIPRAKKVVGDKLFCELPQNVKIALVNAVYRGDLKHDHTTAELIRKENWCKVKAEYLNYGQYKNCKKLGIPGVCTRMDWNAAQFQTLCPK